jgi:hexosaminidase
VAQERPPAQAAASQAAASQAAASQAAASQVAMRKHNLMPTPAVVRFLTGSLNIDSSFNVAVDGFSDDRLKSAIDRACRRLGNQVGFEINRKVSTDPATATLVIKCQGAGKAIPAVDENETYWLEVTTRQAALNAPTVVGIIRGLETFLQLLGHDQTGYFIPSVSIQDKPRFQWRGLLVDVARHYEPPEVMKRTLDGMAAVKLNVLHWHLTDDQGFRVESHRYPELAKLGSDGLYYTQDQIREIITYARDRGIRVVPEFDMPGHITSWLVSHPELGSASGPYRIERGMGIFHPAFDPTREDLYKFLEGFYAEMALLFPDDYMHIGGDENEGSQWSANQKIQEFMKQKGIENNQALQAYFNQRLYKILKRHGKRMMGWDEILTPDLPKDVLVQSWRGPQSLAQAAKQGVDGILSSGYYIDLMYPASKHYLVDPMPAGSELDQQQAAHILGGEATMWGEWVSPENIDSRIWPRTAAIAERFWSQATVNDVDDMYRRLEVVSRELEDLGLGHERNVNVILRRLAGTSDISALRTLVDLVEPVKEYNRGRLHPQTTLAPLTRIVDAARPDSQAARRLQSLVDGLLGDAPRFEVYRDQLHTTLTGWRDLNPRLDRMIEASPALQNAAPLAQDLEEIGRIGLEALSFVSTGNSPPEGWRQSRLDFLSKAAKPRAELEFAIIPAARELVVAASSRADLDGMAPDEWLKRVKANASAKPPDSKASASQ